VTVVSLMRRAVWSVDLDDTQVVPLVAGASPAMALAVLGSVLGQMCTSLRRDRALLRQWLSNDEGFRA
jgi:hypothetical protein